MNGYFNTTKFCLASSVGIVAGIFSELFGVWNDELQALVILMAIDFITGLIVAGLFQKSIKTKSGKMSSDVCFKGIAKKVATLLLVAVAFQVDKLLGFSYIKTTVTCGLCASEILSIMENTGSMGILPKSVQRIFNRVMDALNRNTDTITHSANKNTSK